MHTFNENKKDSNQQAVSGMLKTSGGGGSIMQLINDSTAQLNYLKFQHLANSSTESKNLQLAQKTANKSNTISNYQVNSYDTNDSFENSTTVSQVAQRVIALVGYDPAKENDADPLVADSHASVGRALVLLKKWHGGEPHTDFKNLTEIDADQPLNILGHGSATKIQDLDAAGLAGVILRLKNLDELTLINLYSCSTNSLPEGLAAQLKTILAIAGHDIPIFAPPGLLSIGPADSEVEGTATYPPELREALDVAKEKLLNSLAAFKARKDTRMEELRADASRWNTIVNERIKEVFADDKLSMTEKQKIVQIQTRNFANKSDEISMALKAIEREKSKVELAGKTEYLASKEKAVGKVKPLPGDALVEVEKIVDAAKLEELEAKAKDIMALIEFENTPFDELLQAQEQDVAEDIEFGPFVGATDQVNADSI